MVLRGVPWQQTVGAISGALAVATSAFGAHGMSKTHKPEYIKVWDTGARFQLVHSVALLVVPALSSSGSKARVAAAAHVSGGLLTAGMALFCGSCYAVAYQQDRSLGKGAPIGGMSLMLGWLSFAFLRR